MSKLGLPEVDVLCALFEEYSKNSVFQLNEYADVSKIHTKLKKISDEKDENNSFDKIEIVYLINMLQITSTRYKTPIQNWKRILEIYENLIKILKEIQDAEKADSEEKKEESNLDMKSIE